MAILDTLRTMAESRPFDALLPGMNGALCRWPGDLELAESVALRMERMSPVDAVVQAFDAGLVDFALLCARMRCEGDRHVRDAIQAYHLAGCALGMLTAPTADRIDRAVGWVGMDAGLVRRAMETAVGGETEKVMHGLAAGLRLMRVVR